MTVEAGATHYLFRRGFMCLFGIDDAHPAVQLLDLHLLKHPQILTWCIYAFIWCFLNLLTAIFVAIIVARVLYTVLWVSGWFVVEAVKAMTRAQPSNAPLRAWETREGNVIVGETTPGQDVNNKENGDISTGVVSGKEGVGSVTDTNTRVDAKTDILGKYKAHQEKLRREQAQKISISPLFPKSKRSPLA